MFFIIYYFCRKFSNQTFLIMKRILFLTLSLIFFSCSTEEKNIGNEKEFVTCPTYNENGELIDERGELITLKSGVVVEKKDDTYVYLGDILLSPEDLKSLEEKGELLSKKDVEYNPRTKVEFLGEPLPPETGFSHLPMESTSVGISPNIPRFWTMVRYKFADNVSEYQKSKVLEAIKHIEEETNARFYDSTGEPDRHPFGFAYPNIVFTASDKNQSYIGKIGGNQPLFLYNFEKRGVIVHEICHALGMYHEQSRTDRDSYISVYYENIQPKYHDQFQKVENNYFIRGTFDFNSVMLYSSNYFSIGSKPSMTKKNGEVFTAQREGLSELDRMWINTFYLPFVARKDVCTQLDTKVYDMYNRVLSDYERIELERRLNQNRCSYPLPQNR